VTVTNGVAVTWFKAAIPNLKLDLPAKT